MMVTFKKKFFDSWSKRMKYSFKSTNIIELRNNCLLAVIIFRHHYGNCCVKSNNIALKVETNFEAINNL